MDPECPECDDGDPCTIGECVDDACVITPRCDDGDPCTVDSCSEDGTCTNEPLCDDGLGCTLDTCNPDGTCSFVPMDEICELPRECVAASTCMVPPTPGPGQRVVDGAISGCFNLLDDGFCTNTWDGCACNGAEMCVGTDTGGDPVSGCAPAVTRDQWPCDASVGDGNGCTEENCCEPWDPDGCRLHAEIAENTPDDEVSQYEQFCGAVQATTVSTPLGTVECVDGNQRYSVPGVDPVLGEPLPAAKPNGYWCEDCEPCSVNVCDAPTGSCEFPDILDGNTVPAPPTPWVPPFLTIPTYSACTTPQFCDGETNFGCGFDACYGGTCRSGPHPTNGGMSAACDGYPVVEFDEDSVPPFPNGGSQTCFELGCENIGTDMLPNWTCTAAADDGLCENDLFCDGPGDCSLDEFCFGCNSEQVGQILASIATSFDPDPPPGGLLIHGCVPPEEASPCDDGVACTVDVCSEDADSCQNDPDDRNCVVDDGAAWSPCDPAAVCMADGCAMPDADPCGGTDQCPIECLPLDNGRLCDGDAEICGEEVCRTESYVTVPLEPITDLCPFHPDGTVPEGDREFDGNGPVVHVSVSLATSLDRHQIIASVHFEARETAPDHSTISWDSPPIVVYTTAGEILSINSPTTGFAYGISADGGTPGLACGGCGIVDFTTIEGVIVNAEARGDTPAGDISNDDNCDGDTLLQLLEFDEVEIQLREDCLI